MFTGIIIFIIILTILITFLVLAQNPKGGSVGSAFGGGSSQIMGVQKQGDILEKLTWGFAIGIMVLSIGANILIKDGNSATTKTTENEQIRAAEEESTIESFSIPSGESEE